MVGQLLQQAHTAVAAAAANELTAERQIRLEGVGRDLVRGQQQRQCRAPAVAGAKVAGAFQQRDHGIGGPMTLELESGLGVPKLWLIRQVARRIAEHTDRLIDEALAAQQLSCALVAPPGVVALLCLRQ